MYRTRGDSAGTKAPRGLVTLATFLDPIEAHMARARLEAADIFAVVVEPTGFNPLLTAAAGGVEVKVRAAEAQRAQAILDEPVDAPIDDDDGEEEDAVRCPRCELAYCNYGHPPIRSAADPLLGIFAIVLRIVARKRWYCQKCEHVWDDPKEGPRAITPLLAGAPRPVFRLRRAHAGLGLFIGLMI